MFLGVKRTHARTHARTLERDSSCRRMTPPPLPASGVTEVGIIQVAEVPEYTYDYTLPFKLKGSQIRLLSHWYPVRQWALPYVFPRGCRDKGGETRNPKSPHCEIPWGRGGGADLQPCLDWYPTWGVHCQAVDGVSVAIEAGCGDRVVAGCQGCQSVDVPQEDGLVQTSRRNLQKIKLIQFKDYSWSDYRYSDHLYYSLMLRGPNTTVGSN